MLETKKISDTVIQFINLIVLDNTPPRLELLESDELFIREFIHVAFKKGYEDCLKDVREGLIK